MAQVIVTFSASAADGGEAPAVMLDAAKNRSRTRFTYGETAWFSLFADDITRLSVSVSDGVLTAGGAGSVTLEEQVLFTDEASARLPVPASAVSEVIWLGRSLGALTLTDPRTLTAEKHPQEHGAAAALVRYQAKRLSYGLTLPVRPYDSYPVAVAVRYG